MKRFLELLRRDDRTRLLISAAATGAVLLFAILFPLALRKSAPPDAAEGLRLEERAALFARYWAEGEACEDISAEKPETEDPVRHDLCAARMQGIIAVCVADEGLDDTSPTGSEYTVLSDGVRDMTVCRMWLERTGDWKNWLDVCFDADTGEIYYLYLSRECIANRGKYTAAEDFGCERAAAALAEELSGTLRFADEKTNGSMTAVVSAADGTIGYTIDCVSYDNLVDMKINCF